MNALGGHWDFRLINSDCRIRAADLRIGSFYEKVEKPDLTTLLEDRGLFGGELAAMATIEKVNG
ncbi:MAG: hypothetical protein NVS9B5_10470 [Terriglobales bacterium]